MSETEEIGVHERGTAPTAELVRAVADALEAHDTGEARALVADLQSPDLADLIELPVTVAQWGSRRLATGGGFFRMLPAKLTDIAVGQVNRDRHDAIFYFHPWEVDPDQPRVAHAPLRSRVRHYSRLGAMAGKLRGLLGRHDWGRVDQVAAEEAARLA